MRVQLSEATATLLRAFNDAHAADPAQRIPLRPNSSLVYIKGKGHLQTYCEHPHQQTAYYI